MSEKLPLQEQKEAQQKQKAKEILRSVGLEGLRNEWISEEELRSKLEDLKKKIKEKSGDLNLEDNVKSIYNFSFKVYESQDGVRQEKGKVKFNIMSDGENIDLIWGNEQMEFEDDLLGKS